MRTTKKINGKEYMTAGKAAEILALSKPTILLKCRQGKLSHLRLGCEYLFLPEWLSDFVNENTKIGVAK